MARKEAEEEEEEEEEKQFVVFESIVQYLMYSI